MQNYNKILLLKIDMGAIVVKEVINVVIWGLNVVEICETLLIILRI